MGYSAHDLEESDTPDAHAPLSKMDSTEKAYG